MVLAESLGDWEGDIPLHWQTALDTLEPRFLLSHSTNSGYTTELEHGDLQQGWGLTPAQNS